MKQSIRLCLGAMMLTTAATAMADSTIVTTVDGAARDKDLVSMTFDGDNVILTYHDSSTETADMGLVTVALSHEDKSAIESIISDEKKPAGVYNLKGQRIADTPENCQPGTIIIYNGKKLIVK